MVFKLGHYRMPRRANRRVGPTSSVHRNCAATSVFLSNTSTLRRATASAEPPAGSTRATQVEVPKTIFGALNRSRLTSKLRSMVSVGEAPQFLSWLEFRLDRTRF